MALQFRRFCKVTVEIENDGTTAKNLDVSNCHIEFEVLRSLKPHTNTATVKIFNLTDNHRAALSKRNRPNPDSKKLIGVPMTIDAGFNDIHGMILKSDMAEVSSTRPDLDWETMLVGDDGGRAWREARINAHFAKGTAVRDIVRQCAKALGVGVGNLESATEDVKIPAFGGDTIPHGVTLSGNVAKELTRVMRSLRTADGAASLTWSIQNGALQVLSKGQALRQKAILLTPETGLLESPMAAINSTVSLGHAQQFAPGAKQKVAKAPKPFDPSIIKFKALLNPGLTPGRQVEIRSRSFNAVYVIQEVLFRGNNEYGEWNASCVARPY